MEQNATKVENEKLDQILILLESLMMKQPSAVQELKLHTSAEAARVLNVSESTLKNLRRDGHIEYVQQGHLVRFTPNQLSDYMEANTKRAFNAKKGGAYGRI